MDREVFMCSAHPRITPGRGRNLHPQRVPSPPQAQWVPPPIPPRPDAERPLRPNPAATAAVLRLLGELRDTPFPDNSQRSYRLEEIESVLHD
eukprot:6253696-Amphidinium_carterae.1